jgi:hypothetical protein
MPDWARRAELALVGRSPIELATAGVDNSDGPAPTDGVIDIPDANDTEVDVGADELTAVAAENKADNLVEVGR